MSQAKMAKQLKSGFLLLAGRSALTKILQIISSLLLAYKLIPEDYGSFGIIYGYLSALIFVTDIGLGEFLIQKKDHVRTEEMSTYIGIRLILGFFWMAFFIMSYPFLIKYYHFNFAYKEYVIFLALILPMDTYIGAATVVTQKNMNFKDFAKIELYESVLLYVIQISLVFLNFKVWSFFIAIFISRLLKTLFCMNLLEFKIKPTFNLSLFQNKYKTAFYFQLNSIIPTTKAIFLPIILAFYLDIHTIGIIFWITSLVSTPLVLAFNYNSILFPALSKFQDNEISAKELATHSMEKMLLILAFVFGLGGVIGDQVIDLVFNKNWADAKGLVFVCAIYHFLYSARYICYPILYAKNLANRRTIGELLLVISEYLCVYLFCQKYLALGYFLSLIGINLLSFYFFSYFVKSWLRPFTMLRFHLVFIGIILSFGIIKSVNLPPKNVTSLISEAFIFIAFISLFLLTFDVKFREIVSHYKKKLTHNLL
jgi:O-antigen/teichoic acid export membrane protein